VMKKLITAFKSELGSFSSILDVGVGTARFAKPLQEVGLQIVGVDISKKMVGKAKNKDTENLLLGEACFLPFKKGSFDAAICVHLLHLIGKWKTALKEICRVANDVMISLFYVKDDPVRKGYDCLLRKYGFERKRPGKSEQELKNFVTPARLVFVSSYETRADHRLENLAQGTSSSQWHIPQGVNQQIVKELRNEFAGKMFQQELYLSTWRIEDLRAFVEESEGSP
jgi:ubiquinone/menaquinone biosynthesis C-methylase UbiE